MNYNFSAIQIMGIIISIVFLTIIIIAAINYIFNTRPNYNGRNIFQFRRTFLLFGFVISLASIFTIFNWTTTVNAQNSLGYLIPENDEIEIEIPITRHEPKKLPPPPPPPVIELIPDNEIVEEEQPEFLSIDIEADDPIDIPTEYYNEDIPEAMPVIKHKEDDGEIISFAEEMPLFPGCSDVSRDERSICATKKLYKYIYDHLNYPRIAQETGIQGKVTLRFAVDKNGSISKIKILRDIGGGCGNAALNTIKSMNNMSQKWTPGKQAGRPVNVWFTLPVIFKLSE